MSAPGVSHGELAAKVIVEGCLGNIAGLAEGKFPPGGVSLGEEDRAALGLQPGGKTLLYTLGETGVYANFQGAATTVWFQGADSGDALWEFERALKAAFPKAVQREDKAAPNDEWSRHRSFDVPLSPTRAATVDVAYPAPGARAEGFMARILAYAPGAKN